MYSLILILPLLSFLIIIFLGRKLGTKGVFWISSFLIGISLTLAMVLFFYNSSNPSIIYYKGFIWFNLNNNSNYISLTIDKINSPMALLVCTVSFFVHIFSLSYMKEDPHYPRFISYLSLFTFFMLFLILTDSILALFVGWEGVGICSYLLINFWYTRIEANKSAIKAMVINKIGDLGLILGILIIYKELGDLNYNTIFSLSSNFINQHEMNINQIAGILLLIGVIGKSAQFGLHTWLPDAMEGPTPVSALIHAATMVTAGVFLLIRMSPFFENFPMILLIILFIGSLTSLFAGSIGLVQKDIKKIIAYSTCSQLGYMVLICGFSFYNLSLFHLINHGFFKALLFLSSGSIIHAIADEQDIRKIGRLNIINPVTYICFVIGSLSLMGLPFLSGFYSKDLIIEVAYSNFFFRFTFWISLISACLTSFYSIRGLHYVFFSNTNIQKKTFKSLHESDNFIIVTLSTLAILSISFAYLNFSILMKDEIPIPINLFYKNLPFIFSISAIIVFTILNSSLIKLYFFKAKTPIKNIYFFLSNNWNFNNIINSSLFNIISKFSLSISYKLLDNQTLEFFGPKNIFSKIKNISSYQSIYNQGNLYLYIFSLLYFIILIIILYQ